MKIFEITSSLCEMELFYSHPDYATIRIKLKNLENHEEEVPFFEKQLISLAASVGLIISLNEVKEFLPTKCEIHQCRAFINLLCKAGILNAAGKSRYEKVILLIEKMDRKYKLLNGLTPVPHYADTSSMQLVLYKRHGAGMENTSNRYMLDLSTPIDGAQPKLFSACTFHGEEKGFQYNIQAENNELLFLKILDWVPEELPDEINIELTQHGKIIALIPSKGLKSAIANGNGSALSGYIPIVNEDA